MSKFRKSLQILPLILLVIFVGACNGGGEILTPPPITPDVPSVEDFNAAITRWSNGGNTDYYIEVEETQAGETSLIRVVIADGEIRAAQRLLKTGGEYQPPEAMPLSGAEAYTVDALLARLQRDARGEGAAPMNMLVVFDPISGYPAVVETSALPSKNEDGDVKLNREHSYALGIHVDVLIEDTVGFGREPLFELVRSGGDAAWCDKLRIFADGSSIYTDECRRTLLQNNPPRARFEEIQSLAAEFSMMDTFLSAENEFQNLVIVGSGEGEPTPAEIETAWRYASELHELLSEPIGAGLTMLYSVGRDVLGFDMRSLVGQPGTLSSTGSIRGISVDLEGKYLSYADDTGLRAFDLQNGDDRLLLRHPSDSGEYVPMEWGTGGRFVVMLQPNESAHQQLGWVQIGDTVWKPIPAPPEGGTYGCPAGVSWSPDGAQFAAAFISDGEGCAGQDGLYRFDLTTGEVVRVLPGDAGAVRNPDWSWDGEKVSVTLAEGNLLEDGAHSRIYLLNPDGTDLEAITENSEGNAEHPTWSPDGLLYYALDGAETGADGIYQYNPASGAHFLLSEGSGFVLLDIAPTAEYMVYDTFAGLGVWMFGFEQHIPIAGVRADGTIPVFAGWLQAK